MQGPLLTNTRWGMQCSMQASRLPTSNGSCTPAINCKVPNPTTRTPRHCVNTAAPQQAHLGLLARQRLRLLLQRLQLLPGARQLSFRRQPGSSCRLRLLLRLLQLLLQGALEHLRALGRVAHSVQLGCHLRGSRQAVVLL
jgi:hypothetical protein